jgi:DNA-binding NtrC family response regulator
MAKKGFRQDLYFRLNVARINLPPLRERKEDIPLLLDHFAQKFSGEFGCEIKGFTEEAMELLKSNDWPGNIRELMNLVERIFIDPPAEKINVSDLPEPMQSRPSRRDEVPEERELLLYTLSETNWNKSKAAERLHWSRMTLYRKMAKYHIKESAVEDYRFAVASHHSRNNLAARVTKV